ncbi:transcriptional regulator [Photobacterium aquae]|uniref:Transcriptional regulator n=1 Tax=Photobacterium aquae TaxID=1195763 RepID=A0A0J1GVG4_9GAMM|nr:WYL domain-containing protein [Photobacterium aquae]KLV03646.1 transcriptional regulator [Photobacterium aquae]
MTSRTNTQESLTLAFEILKRIPRHRKITAPELHTQLQEIGIERSIRTIQRNLEMLSENFELDRDTRSKPYGYSWRKMSNGLSANYLTTQESLLLSLAEQYLKLILPTKILSSLESYFDEARYNLEHNPANTRAKSWRNKIRVVSETIPLLAPQMDPEVLSLISEALYEDRLITVEYYNAEHKRHTATVMPLGLAQQGVRLYLVCRFDGFDNERTLAIHRIKKVVVSTFNFKRPQDFTLEKYDTDGRFGFGEGDSCFIEFLITKKAGFHLLETPLSKDQIIEECEGHYKISATVIDSLQLERWIRGFGSDITLLSKIRDHNVCSTV